MPRLYAAIAAGGMAGTLARYAVSLWLQAPDGATMRGTLAVNLAGSLLLGFVLHHAVFDAQTAPALRAAVAVGFCGAFTTMSAFALELVRLGQMRQWTVATWYAGVTLAGCVAAVLLGLAAAQRLSPFD